MLQINIASCTLLFPARKVPRCGTQLIQALGGGWQDSTIYAPERLYRGKLQHSSRDKLVLHSDCDS